MTGLNWRARAACASHEDPDLWFKEGGRALAIHICRSHCPVLADCAALTALTSRNAGCVFAGVVYNQHGAPIEHRQSSADCPTCVAARAAAKPGTQRYPDCGTPTALRRHRRNKQTPCRPCSLAGAQERADQRTAKAQVAA